MLSPPVPFYFRHKSDQYKVGEITSLNHEVLDNTMKFRSTIVKRFTTYSIPLFPGTQRTTQIELKREKYRKFSVVLGRS